MRLDLRSVTTGCEIWPVSEPWPASCGTGEQRAQSAHRAQTAAGFDAQWVQLKHKAQDGRAISKKGRELYNHLSLPLRGEKGTRLCKTCDVAEDIGSVC